MGKKRVVVITEEGLKKKVAKKSLKDEKGVRVPGLKGGERVVAVTAEPVKEEKKEEKEEEKREEEKPKKARPPKKRGKKYKAAKAKIDPTKNYSPPEAIKLLKETAYSKFNGKAEIHLRVSKKGLQTEAELPYFQAKDKKIVVADDKVLEQIEKNKIDFDVLLATPKIMPKLMKFAKVLGPKGLMPNPKKGTLVDEPQKAIKKFQKPSINIRTEKNAPLIHLVFGRIKQPEKELIANLETVIKAIGEKNIKKATISSTMSPGIKVKFD